MQELIDDLTDLLVRTRQITSTIKEGQYLAAMKQLALLEDEISNMISAATGAYDDE